MGCVFGKGFVGYDMYVIDLDIYVVIGVNVEWMIVCSFGYKVGFVLLVKLMW